MKLLIGTPAEIAEYMDRRGEIDDDVDKFISDFVSDCGEGKKPDIPHFPLIVPQESHVDALLKEAEFYRKTKVRDGGEK